MPTTGENLRPTWRNSRWGPNDHADSERPMSLDTHELVKTLSARIMTVFEPLERRIAALEEQLGNIQRSQTHD